MRKIFLILFLCISGAIFAQKYSNSPYSANGIGEFGGLDHATFSGLGHSTAGLIDSTVLNYFNPSSYASLGKGQPLFTLGVSGRFSNYTEGANTSTGRVIGMDHFAMAIPFGNRFGLAFGLKPFSRTGYSFNQTEIVVGDSIRYDYEGSGGTNEAFTGFAINVLKTKDHMLGLGFNLGYVFGKTLNLRRSVIINGNNSFARGEDEDRLSINAFHTDLGLNYQWRINQHQRLALGATYSPQLNFNVKNTYGVYFKIFDINNSNYNVYTLLYSTQEGTITMPSVLSLGFMYAFKPNRDPASNKTKIYELMVTGEYKQMDWENYRTNFGSPDTTSNFLSTKSYSFGVQFVPHSDFLDRSSNINYLYRMRYRAGIRYMELPTSDNGTQHSDFGITFGLGLPIATQRSVSSINIGFTAGQRGNGLAQSVNEKYLGINFGVTLAPGSYDKWFRRFKID
jgi:hypothetical protein